MNEISHKKTIKSKTSSLSRVKETLLKHEMRYQEEGHAFSHQLMHAYMKAIDFAITHDHIKYANQWVEKSLRLYHEIKEHIMYALIPGLHHTHLNERMLYHMHHPIFGLMYYYNCHMIFLTKDKKGLERNVDQALAILTFNQQKLSKTYREVLLKVIELKQSLYLIDDIKQFELILMKKKLFRHHQHLFQCYKELGDHYFNKLQFKQAHKNYHIMNQHATYIIKMNTDLLETYMNALERNVIACVHLKEYSKAEESIDMIIDRLKQSDMRLDTHIESMILPYQLLFYVFKASNNQMKMIHAYEQIMIYLKQYEPYNKHKHTWVEEIINELHQDLEKMGYHTKSREED